jgi:hypothetical protein
LDKSLEHKLLITLKIEDGGTPGFLQVIKTALVIQLKEKWVFKTS